jgi:hypothetical protein
MTWILVGILLSTVQDPTSFDNFTNSSGGQQLARNFASASGTGGFCIPLNLSSAGISGVADGANVTIQLLFNGGDDSLFQVRLRAIFQSSSQFRLTNSNPVRGPDTVEHFFYPIQCLLFQRHFHRDFSNLDLDRQEWRERNFHIGLRWRARLPGGAGHSLVVSLASPTNDVLCTSKYLYNSTDSRTSQL